MEVVLRRAMDENLIRTDKTLFVAVAGDDRTATENQRAEAAKLANGGSEIAGVALKTTCFRCQLRASLATKRKCEDS